VQTLFETGDKEVGFITAGNWDGLNPSGNTAPPIVCLATTDGTCRILWNQPQRRVELQLPDESRGLGSAIGTAEGKLFLRVSRPEGGWGPPSEALLQRWQEKYRLRPYKEWMELYEISPAGQTDLISRYEWTRPAWSMRRMGDRVRSAVTVASSPLFSLAWRWHYRDVWASWWHYPDVWGRQGRETATVTVGIAEWLREMRPTHPVTNLAVSALGVAIACWHAWARRTSWSKFAFWMALVAGFSLAGLLTYLALNHTPTIRCPGCGRKRSLRRPSCPACHALLPAPRPRDVDLILPAGCERPVGEGRQGAV
jgi:hypothetical protein